MLFKLGQIPSLRTLLLWCAIATLVCSPSLFVVGSIVGLDEPRGDRANTLWLQWALYSEAPIEHTVFAPFGMDLQLNYFNLLDIYLATPLIGLLGWPEHYNYFVFLTVVFNVAAAFGFARVVGARSSTAMILGVLFAVSFPFLNAIENGRLIQSMVGVLPLACIGIWRIHDSPSLKNALLAAGLVGLSGWTYLYFGYAIAVISVYISVVRWRTWRKTHWLLVYYILTAGLAWWLVKDLSDYYDVVQQQVSSFPEASLMFQPRYFATAGAILDHSVSIGFWGWSSKASLPTVLFVAAMIGLIRKSKWQLVPLLLLFSVLALGPYLQTDQGLIGLAEQRLIGSPLYLWMYEHVPLVHRMHWPERWLGVIATLLIPLAVRGLETFSLSKWIVVSVMVFVFVEARFKEQWPLSYTTFEPPKCYLELADQPDGLLLMSPFIYSSRAIVYQPLHGKDIINPIGSGYDEKKWLEAYHRFLRQMTFIGWIREYDNPGAQPQQISATDIQVAKEMGLRYFAHHWTYLKEALDSPDVSRDHGLDEKRAREAFVSLLGEPSCSDDDVAIWAF